MLTLENSSGLAAVLVAQYFDYLRAEQLVRWAQDALSEGHDTPSILRLAIAEPPFFTPDLMRLFESALSEAGIEQVTIEQARIFHAQRVLEEMLSSAQPARAIAAQLAQLFPAHDTLRRVGEWWLLEEAFWCEYCRVQAVTAGESIERVVLNNASTLLNIDWRAP